MKKLLFASLLLVAGPMAAFAQSKLSNNPQSSPRFRSNNSENQGVGIKAGANFCNISGDGAGKLYGDTKSKVLYHFGAYAQIGITNRLSIQPELLYQRKGYKVIGDVSVVRNHANTADSATNTRNYTTKLSYLSVPILVVFNVLDNVAIQLGPQVSYLLNVREGAKVVDATAHKYQSVEVSALAGVEAKFEFLRAGVRYDYSLTDVRKSGGFTIANIQSRSESDFKNGVFQVYLGFGL